MSVHDPHSYARLWYAQCRTHTIQHPRIDRDRSMQRVEKSLFLLVGCCLTSHPRCINVWSQVSFFPPWTPWNWSKIQGRSTKGSPGCSTKLAAHVSDSISFSNSLWPSAPFPEEQGQFPLSPFWPKHIGFQCNLCLLNSSRRYWCATPLSHCRRQSTKARLGS